MLCTFIFKCRRCKEEYADCGGGVEPVEYGLRSAVYGIPYPKKLGGVPPELHSIHYCKDGKFVGVSDLIGYIKEESK